MALAHGDAAAAQSGALARWLGPAGSDLRRWRVLLAFALALLLAWLVGPYAAFRLPGDPTLVPQPGQSRIHTVLVSLWWAAALNAALCALLLATSGAWAGRSAAEVDAERSTDRSRAPRRPGLGVAGIGAVLAAAALAGVLRWPLAHGSVWWDEAWTLRHVIVGNVDPDPNDPTRVEYSPSSWIDTLWYYRTPTNHVAYSVAARASLGAWRLASGAVRPAFDEFAFRFPAWLAAVVTVVLVGALVAALGFPVAAPAAAALLALHPWHVRYGADGRGYSFVLCFALAGALFLLRFLRAGRWRDALGCAASQLALLWTFPLGVYVPLALGAAGCAAIALGDEPREVRRRSLGRWLVAHALAAMAFVQLMLPNLAQAVAFDKEWRDRVPLEPPWLRQLWVYLTLGVRMREPREPDVVFPTFAVLRDAWPWLSVVVYGVLPALALAGCARVALRAGRRERAVFGALVLAVALFLLHRAVHGFFVLQRFAFFALAALVPALAIGAEGALRAVVRRDGARRVALPLGLAAALAGYAALAAPQLRVLWTHPPTPSREVAAFLAARDREAPRGVLRAGLGLGGEVAHAYDPWLVRVETRDELDALAARARAEGRPLYVVFSYAALNAKRIAALFDPVLDERWFEPVARFDGIDGELVIRVRRYTGAPLGAESRGG
jgi:hypothetical protein